MFFLDFKKKLVGIKQSEEVKKIKVIISGGGTGGHIFPAISIANALKAKDPSIEILFVGAEGKMEMERVPAAGYQIVGLPVRGFERKLTLRNVKVLLNLMKSLKLAKSVIRSFQPDIAVGVGGYASGPLLKIASKFGVPCLLQEQNSYAGVTNKLLAQKAAKICVAYDQMDRFFPADRIVKTGNPVRQNLLDPSVTREEAAKFFGIDSSKKVILVLGGSLGARTINNSIIAQMAEIGKREDVVVIWQTGKLYIENAKAALAKTPTSNLIATDFIARMDYAYRLADVVVSRSGASTVSELCILAKPVIFVPSPNVAEDHQTKNAMALVEKKAALIVTDANAPTEMVKKALELVDNEQTCTALGKEIGKLALPNAASDIADEVLRLIK